MEKESKSQRSIKHKKLFSMAFIAEIYQLENPLASVFNAKATNCLREQLQCAVHSIATMPNIKPTEKNEVNIRTLHKVNTAGHGSRNIIIAEPSFLMRLAFFRTRFIRMLCLFRCVRIPNARFIFFTVLPFVGLPPNRIYGISYVH